MIFSWRSARRHRFTLHRSLQISLALTLLVAVGLFELDMTLSGGIFALTADSAYSGTTLLNGLIYGHMLVAILAALIWLPLVIVSMRRFPRPPVSNAFGPAHRVWGRAGMVLMMLSGVSAVPLYVVGFAL